MQTKSQAQVEYEHFRFINRIAAERKCSYDDAVAAIDRDPRLKAQYRAAMRARTARQMAAGATSQVLPKPAATPSDPYRPLAEQRAKDKGISFHAAYQQVVAENPKLYERYQAERQAMKP